MYLQVFLNISFILTFETKLWDYMVSKILAYSKMPGLPGVELYGTKQ